MDIRIRIGRKSISFSQVAYLLLILLAVIRATHFHVVRGDNMDFARHMRMMELIKNSQYSFIDYVFLHGDAFTSNISLKFCYGFNAIMYLAAKCFVNYFWVSWLFVLADYCIISYIGINWWKSAANRGCIMAIYEVMICFSLLPYIHAVSGLRTAFAACLVSLSIYMYLYRNKSFLYFIVISILAASFHPAFITAIPFVILAKIFDRKTGFLISLAGGVSVMLLANVFIHSSNRFLYSIAYKYLQYAGDSGYKGTRFCYYGVIAISVLVLIQYINCYLWKVEKTHQKSKNALRIFDFIAFYMIFVLTNIGKYEMVLRPGYLLGAMAPMITGLVFCVQTKNKRNNLISHAVLLLLLVVLLYVSYKYLVWHKEFFV